MNTMTTLPVCRVSCVPSPFLDFDKESKEDVT